MEGRATPTTRLSSEVMKSAAPVSASVQPRLVVGVVILLLPFVIAHSQMQAKKGWVSQSSFLLSARAHGSSTLKTSIAARTFISIPWAKNSRISCSPAPERSATRA